MPQPYKQRAIILMLLVSPATLLAENMPTDIPPITLSVDHGDGGNRGIRHTRKLLSALTKEGCKVVVSDPPGQTPGGLHFDPAAVSVAASRHPEHKLIARANTPKGDLFIRGAILVHASRGIVDLSSLKGQRIAFVSKNSPSGYQLPLELLLDAGIKERWDTFFYVGNHVGSVGMLLHGDTDVAVVAEPLAQRWAEYNDLSIVAVSDEIETGGWWIHKSVPKEAKRRCAQAFNTLDHSSLTALPAWIGGFTSLISSD